jgi:ABC-2 type transport system permease protein
VPILGSDFRKNLSRAFYIAKKDAKVYYFKAPNFTYALLMPISLFLAFSLTGQVNLSSALSGLTALAVLFGTTSIEAVAVVLEKQTGTFERLLAAPISFFTLVFGKALAGVFFGLILAAGMVAPLMLLSGTGIANPVLFFAAVMFSSLTFSSLGVLVSAYAKWVPEAQMLDNFLRFPMAFLSGIFFSLTAIPSQLQFIPRLLPLTYSVEALNISVTESAFTGTYLVDILVMALFSVILLLLATTVLRRKTT